MSNALRPVIERGWIGEEHLVPARDAGDHRGCPDIGVDQIGGDLRFLVERGAIPTPGPAGRRDPGCVEGITRGPGPGAEIDAIGDRARGAQAREGQPAVGERCDLAPPERCAKDP